MEYTIQSDRLQVTAHTLGAQLQSVQLDGTQRLWQNPDGSWDGHAPILFPFCGNCAMRLREQDYGPGVHGHVCDKEFVCTEKTQDTMAFLLECQGIPDRYPFPFALQVTYQVCQDRLQVTYQVENRGNQTLYYACGGHESFNLQEDVDAYELVFPKPQPLIHYPHDGKGRLTGEQVSMGQGPVLPLSKALLSGGNTMILGALQSREVTLRHRRSGKPVAQIWFSGFGNLLLWRPGNARMICLEPWQNLPDSVDQTWLFSEKDGVQALKPGCRTSYTRQIRYF